MKPIEKIRVGVVEDDARLRRVLSEVFSGAQDCDCVGIFANGETAVAQLPALKPDVVTLDINLPDLSGVECITRIAPLMPETQFLMLTTYQDTNTIFQALSAGAHGYLVKPVMPLALLSAIREIRSGGVPMSRTIARNVIEYFRQPKPAVTAEPSPADTPLGQREQQILEFLVAGLSYKEISGELGIAVSTVGTYVQRIYEKLHVRNRREIIARQKGKA